MALSQCSALLCKVLYKNRFEECTTCPVAPGFCSSCRVSWLVNLVLNTSNWWSRFFQNLILKWQLWNPRSSDCGRDNMNILVYWKGMLLIGQSQCCLWNQLFEPMIWAKDSGPWWAFFGKWNVLSKVWKPKVWKQC